MQQLVQHAMRSHLAQCGCGYSVVQKQPPAGRIVGCRLPSHRAREFALELVTLRCPLLYLKLTRLRSFDHTGVCAVLWGRKKRGRESFTTPSPPVFPSAAAPAAAGPTPAPVARPSPPSTPRSRTGPPATPTAAGPSPPPPSPPRSRTAATRRAPAAGPATRPASRPTRSP